MLRILLLFLLSGGTSTLIAQQLLSDDYLINTRTLTTEDGLSHNQVNVVYEDKYGIIWLGTQYGLNRYDGYDFKWLTREKDGLTHNIITEIIEDDDDWLWISKSNTRLFYTNRQSLTFVHQQTFEVQTFEEHFDAPSFQVEEIKHIAPLKNFSILFYLNNGNTYHYSSSTGFQETVFKGKNFRPIKGIQEDIFWAQIDNNLLKTNLKGEIIQSSPIEQGYDILDVVTDAKGRTWEAWMKLGKKEDLNDEDIFKQGYDMYKSGLYIREDGKLHLAQEYLQPYFANQGGKQIFPPTHINPSLKLYYHPSLNQIWMKFGKYFQLLDKNLSPAYEGEFFIKNTFIRGEFFFDSQNTLWIPARNGVVVVEIKRNPFTKFLHSNEKKTQLSTRGIAQVGNYLMINGNDNFGLNLQTGEHLNYSKSKEDVLFHPSYIDEENNYWTGGDRVHRVDVSNGNILETFPLNDTKNGRVFTLLKDREGTWWFNIWYKYLFVYNKEIHDKPQLFELTNGLTDWKNELSWQLTEDKKLNAIWMVNETGLYLIDKQKGFIGQYSSKGEGKYYLPSTNYYWMHEDADEVFWIGTRDGLLRIERKYLLDDNLVDRENAFKMFSRVDGLPSNAIFSIEEDENNNLWLGTGNGLVQFNKSTHAIRTFLPEHGTTHQEFNRLSSFKNKDGRMYFGGMNGVTGFNPKDFHQETPYNIPLVLSEVQALKAGNEKIKDITPEILKSNKIVMNYNDQFLELKFSLQDYFYADKIVYEYQIENYKKEWTTLKENILQLGKLPIGHYKLNVRAKGFDNRYSTSELSIPIIAKPPFYLTWWFILIALASIAFGLFQLYLYRTQALKEKKKELEILVAQRTAQIEKDKQIIETQAKELQELDKVKSRFFANVSHELRTPLTLILSPVSSMLNSKELSNKNFTYASVIRQNANNLLKRINEILDLTKLDAKQLEVKNQPTAFYLFVKRLVATFESLAQQKDIQLLFDYQSDKSLQVLLDQDKFEHIFNNFLSNALKYTPKKGSIEVNVSDVQNQLQLAVKDTGQGIHSDDLPKIFDRFYQAKHTKSVSGTGIGLALCRELSQVMNGSVRCESTVGDGSTFFFEFPYKEVMGTLEKQNEMLAPEEKQEKEALTDFINANDSNNGKSTILLVEDNVQLRSYIRLILTEDYHVITAENGKEALERLTVDGIAV